MIKFITIPLLTIVVLTGALKLWDNQIDSQQDSPIIEDIAYLSTEYIEVPEVETKEKLAPEKILLNVPLLLQRPTLPTGCEIVSTTMMLDYMGIDVDPVKLAEEIPYDKNDPSLGYVGNPFTDGGWTIYPEAMIETIMKYLPTAKVMTGVSMDELKEQLALEKPVVVWLSGMHGYTIHSVIVTGYDMKGIYYNDPWSGEKNAWISNDDFLTMWSDQEYRALSY